MTQKYLKKLIINVRILEIFYHQDLSEQGFRQKF